MFPRIACNTSDRNARLAACAAHGLTVADGSAGCYQQMHIEAHYIVVQSIFLLGLAGLILRQGSRRCGELRVKQRLTCCLNSLLWRMKADAVPASNYQAHARGAKHLQRNRTCNAAYTTAFYGRLLCLR